MKYLPLSLALLFSKQTIAQNSLGQLNVISGTRSVYVFNQENTTTTSVVKLPFGANYNSEKSHFFGFGLQALRKVSYKEMLHFWTWGRLSNFQIQLPNSDLRKGAEFDYTMLALVKTVAPHGDFYMGFGPKFKYYLIKNSHGHAGLQWHFSHEAPSWDVKLTGSLLGIGISKTDLGILRDSSQLELEAGFKKPSELGFLYRYALEFNHTHRSYFASKANSGALFVDDAAIYLKFGISLLN